MKIASSLFLIGSNVTQLQILLHQQNQSGFLSNDEIFAIQHFFFDIVMNSHCNTLQSKIQHATQELVKMVQADDKDKIPSLVKFTYADMKKIIEKIISNSRLSNDIFLNNMLSVSPFFVPHQATSHFTGVTPPETTQSAPE